MFNPNAPYLLPNSPKLDKLAALYLLMHEVAEIELDEATIIFHDASKPLPKRFNDVDAVSDYKSSGYGSATERVVREHEISEPGTTRFVSLFNLNNSSGELKNRFAENLFNLINDWPRVGHNVPRDEHMNEAIAAIFPVFDLYFATAGEVGQDLLSVKNPFCLDGINQMAFLLNNHLNQRGVEGDRYDDLVDDLRHMLGRTKQADKATADRAKAIKPELTFELPTQSDQKVLGAVYRSDDRRLSRHLFDLNPAVHLFVMKHRSGNAVIMTRGRQDFSELAKVLATLEPGRWHHETRYRSPFLANGGETRSVEPTSLTPSQIRDLLVKHFHYVTRSQDVSVR